jgi:hypothetical protein
MSIQSVMASSSVRSEIRSVEKRGSVALLVPEPEEYIAMSFIALLTIHRFRHLLIDQPYAQIGKTYLLSKSLGNLAEAIWVRETGTLKPDGLLKYMRANFNTTGPLPTPEMVLHFSFETLN